MQPVELHEGTCWSRQLTGCRSTRSPECRQIAVPTESRASLDVGQYSKVRLLHLKRKVTLCCSGISDCGQVVWAMNAAWMVKMMMAVVVWSCLVICIGLPVKKKKLIRCTQFDSTRGTCVRFDLTLERRHFERPGTRETPPPFPTPLPWLSSSMVAIRIVRGVGTNFRRSATD